MASEEENTGKCQIFEEDEVYKENKCGITYGLVVESSEHYSSDEDDDITSENLKKGTVKVAWHPSGKEEIATENKVHLADRSLMPGDVVRRLIAGEDSQRGYVQHSHVTCHVQIVGTHNVITDIDTIDLQSIIEWPEDPGDVILDNWVGKIDSVSSDYVLIFSDGARCKTDDECMYEFEDFQDKREADSTFNSHTDLYKGQKLRGDARALKKAKWIKTTRQHSQWACEKKPNSTVFPFIEEIITTSLDVHWLCCGYSGSSEKSTKSPPTCIKGENLKRLQKLDCFEGCSVQIGDICFYKLKSSDNLKTVNPQRNRTLINYILKQDKERVKELPIYDSLTLAAKNTKNTHLSTNGDNDCVWSCRAENQTPPSTLHSQQKECKCMISISGDDNDLDAIKTNVFAGCDQCGDEVRNSVDEACDSANNSMQNKQAASGPRDSGADSEYEDVDEESDKSSHTSSTRSNSPSNSPRRRTKKGPVLQTKLMKKKGKKAKVKHQESQPQQYKVGQKVAVEVIYTFSRADIMWQNGVTEKNIPSPELYPIHHLDDCEYFPGDFVLENEADLNAVSRYGTVINVDHSQRTCRVQWADIGSGGSGPEGIFAPVECSVYDIKDHPDYKFRPGNVVVRVGGGSNIQLPKCEAVGQVYELSQEDGKIAVCWPNGKLSECYPQQVYLVNHDDLDDDSDWSSDEDETSDSEDNSWESAGDDDDDGDSENDNNSVDSENENKGTRSKDKESCDKEELYQALIAELPVSPVNKEEWKKHKAFISSVLDMTREAVTHCAEKSGQEVNIVCLCDILKKILNIYKELKKVDRHTHLVVYRSEELKSVMKKLKDIHITLTNDLRKKTLDQSLVNSLNYLSVSDGGTDLSKEADEMAKKVCNTDKRLQGSSVSIETTIEEMVGAVLKEIHTPVDENEKLKETGDVQNKTEGDSPLDTACASVTGNVEEFVDSGKLNNEDIFKCLLQGFKLLLKQTEYFQKLIDKQIELFECQDLSSESMGNTSPVLADMETNGKISTVESEYKEEKAELPEEASGIPTTIAALESSHSDEPLPSTVLPVDARGFMQLECAPSSHKFVLRTSNPTDPKAFFSAITKEFKLLHSSLPSGVMVRAFEDRMDLLSLMIVGPSHTPYEDGLFCFDVQLKDDYPLSPPDMHYISYCTDRLNPNLYEDGKVCISLLGTWSGKGSERWTSKSNLFQVLVSIQGLILVPEPYYNEAGYEKQRGTQQAYENSKMYNEMAMIKLVQSMTKLILNPPITFKEEIFDHCQKTAVSFIQRLESWMVMQETASTFIQNKTSEINSSEHDMSCNSNTVVSRQDNTLREDDMTTEDDHVLYAQSDIGACGPSITVSDSCKFENQIQHLKPDFPLLPVSKGFCLSLKSSLSSFKKALASVGITNC